MDIFLIVAALLAVTLVGTVFFLGRSRGPSIEEVAHLRNPQIRELDSQKVLLVKAKGDPNQVGKQAFGLLMRTYFRLKGVPKGGSALQAPRARWMAGADVPMEEWEGMYAMPVPDSVSELPAGEAKSGLNVGLADWEYGTVAEILHVGRYDSEVSTVEKLHGFIRSQGYRIAGPHEEEYLRGPGFLFPGNPEKYLTMIRYQVRKLDVP